MFRARLLHLKVVTPDPASLNPQLKMTIENNEDLMILKGRNTTKTKNRICYDITYSWRLPYIVFLNSDCSSRQATTFLSYHHSSKSLNVAFNVSASFFHFASKSSKNNR